jgi:hypothetical protein
MGAVRWADPTCASRGHLLDPGTLNLQLTPSPAPLGSLWYLDVPCLPLDLPAPPQPQPAQEQKSPVPPPPPTAAPASPPPPIKDRVKERLDANDFDLPMVVDDTHAFLSGRRLTLDEITDELTDEFPDTNKPDVRASVRAEVWLAVQQAYQQKRTEHEKDVWQLQVQLLYTPQYALWTSQPQSSPWQHNLQLSLGANRRLHRYGVAGLETTLQVSGSFFSLGSDNPDWFQNALLAGQASYVSPIGHEFRLLGIANAWSYLQGSVFAQLAAGAGGSWNTDPSGKRQVYLGFLVQPSAGGQLTLNIGWLQVIAQGAVVYSWQSATTQPESRPSSLWGLQGGLGVGGAW